MAFGEWDERGGVWQVLISFGNDMLGPRGVDRYEQVSYLWDQLGDADMCLSLCEYTDRSILHIRVRIGRRLKSRSFVYGLKGQISTLKAVRNDEAIPLFCLPKKKVRL